MFKKICIICFFIIPLVLAVESIGGDLDDGISEYTDDSVSKYDELGQADKNITFMKMNAKSRAEVKKKSGVEGQSGSTSGTNMNSVVMGAGSNVKGDIIIIDESKGDKFQIVE